MRLHRLLLILMLLAVVLQLWGIGKTIAGLDRTLIELKTVLEERLK